MKCCSRSTLGVTIGVLNVMLYIFASVIFAAFIGQINDENSSVHQQISVHHEKAAEFGTIILCTFLAASLVMIVLSVVLIMGIVKRRHKLMIPWLALSILAFVCDCARCVITVIVGIVSGTTFVNILFTFLLNAVGCGIEVLILWPIYTLWCDIRIDNDEKSGRIIERGVHYEANASAPPDYNYYNSLPQKT